MTDHFKTADTILAEIGMKEGAPARQSIAALAKERDEWKAAATRHHPNPADHRYWEGRYRDEKSRADAAEARLKKILKVASKAFDVEPKPEFPRKKGPLYFSDPGMPFDRAFSIARGFNFDTFVWRDKKYTTERADDPKT